MRPEIGLSAENEDMLMLAKQFEALKVLDGKSEAAPDGEVLSFDDVFRNSNVVFNGSENSSANGDWADGNDGQNSGDGIRDGFLHHLQNLTPFKPHSSSLDVGSLINKGMLKFNPNERNAIYEEVHGVGSLCPPESPALVEAALQNLERELALLPSNQKAAYEQSQRLRHTYVNHREFRLRFIRADCFDAKKSALRLTLFLDTVLEIYGPYALERPIRLSDFSKKEMKEMNSGRIQLLPYRDRGGRRVIVGIPNHNHSRDTAAVRVSFLVGWIAIDCFYCSFSGLEGCYVITAAVSCR
jgi:hypothetical protein